MSSSLPVIFLPKRFLLVAALSLALSTMGYGRTITVMQDGSGDFVEIQPALDAAASGDSILIGPGIYTEMNNYYLPGNGGWVDVGAYVQVENLSIIGSGPEATVIGPTVYEPIDQGPKGIVHLEPGKIVVKDLAIRHFVHGVFLVDSMVAGVSPESRDKST